MKKAKEKQEFAYESDLVESLCLALADYPSNPTSPYCLRREVGVGRSIADVVAFSSDSDFTGDAFTTKESVILSLLRQGPTRIDILEKRCGLERGHLRAGELDRLLEWGLVNFGRGGRVAAEIDSFSVHLFAVEAKLTKWRDALRQATEYLRFADESYVVLPKDLASPAVTSEREFTSRGVGLMILSDGSLEVVVGARQSTSNDWRREFVLSRLLSEVSTHGGESNRRLACGATAGI